MSGRKFLQSFVTPNTLAGLYSQLSYSTFPYQLILYLEGESDIKFYQNHLDINKVKFVNSNGKPNAKAVINKLNSIVSEKKRKSYLALVDSDFENLLNTPTVPNLIRTDCHDLEVQIIFSNPTLDKLRKLLTSYIDANKYAKFQGKVIPTIFLLSYNIGLIKLYSATYNRSICFKEIDYSNILDKDMNFDKENLYKVFLGTYYQNFLGFIDRNGYNTQDKEIINLLSINQICNGHDIINISVFILENYLSNNKPTFKEFEQAIRIQFSKEELEKTNFCIELLEWFTGNGIDRDVITNEHYQYL
ncbi:DUF4435 domain-containing protein [Solibacillus sp. MA9]|uniref:DUF4435 domain-containing protein n=1 Tax=Solibacillus palustris TaxID=2908203 RepID=A0ABS9U7H3_9BACL|nr:DUF4435 domain-containing protein [Solibacillus sp. MA9]MCH7320287.1 DUF4435 domain-containing protein [Solibacillus sp. MA9]